MEDIRGILEKLVKIDETQPVSEAYSIFHWGITDPAEIRAHVIDNLVGWYNSNGWDRGLFVDLLVAYLSALRINPNESPAMKKAINAARQSLVHDYKMLRDDDPYLSFADDLRSGLAKLRQMGIEGKEFAAIERDLAKREAAWDSKYADDKDIA